MDTDWLTLGVHNLSDDTDTDTSLGIQTKIAKPGEPHAAWLAQIKPLGAPKFQRRASH